MSSITPPVIRLEGLTKRFGTVTAVDAVSLDVKDNEFLALLGASGCGKTTLLRLLAGFEQPDAGRILIGGSDVTDVPPYARPVNMMFQSYALFPHMTVAANVAFGLKRDGLKGAALTDKVRDALGAVEMEAFAGRKPAQLSGGQRQRVALARCLAKRPKVLLLDEPMAALDKHLRERTQLELMALRARLGITFIVVTHDQDEAMAMADRVAVMEGGRILQVASPRELYERPSNRAVASFFGDVNLWEGMAGSSGREVSCRDLGCDVATAEMISPGTAVAVAVRPEQISLSRVKSEGGINCLAGVVTDIVYRGTTSTYFVRMHSNAVIRAVRQNTTTDSSFSRGESVYVSWDPAAMRVLSS